MPRTNEITLNGYLAEVLRGKHPLWGNHLLVEQTGVFPEHPRLQPDILIDPPNAQPVIIETEYRPAATVENDARDRLGHIPLNSSDRIEQAIAVRIPNSLRVNQDGLSERIAATDFDYCVFSGDPSSPMRWPETGWLTGNVNDIVRCIENAMVSQRLVNYSMQILERGVLVASQAIKDAADSGYPDIERDMGRILNQDSSEQTIRMAMTIIANALTFHSMIAGSHKIPSVTQLRADSPRSIQRPILDTWHRILYEINYWPIFKIASDLLVSIRAATANKVLDALVDVADNLADIGVTTRHDLSGKLFQNLIADRKFLATFYTLPTSATLLAELAIRRLKTDWSNLDTYSDLCIADLACGTGTLLSAAYQAVLTRYRHAGGDDSKVHKRMIERSIVAADIMPAAVHLCASQLSSVHPTVSFDNTRVYTMPYGKGSGDESYSDIAIGSLDLTDKGQTMSLFTTGHRQATGAQGDIKIQSIELPRESVDLMIMNPPFTRPTKHKIPGVPIPSFAGFGTPKEEQRAMSKRLDSIRRNLYNPAGHGNAGLGSNFLDLAHAKVKTGGTIAFVLPIAVIQGESWQNARDLLIDRYTDITVVTIAAAIVKDRAFSADTSMAEALIVATKRERGTKPDAEILFMNLHRRPSNLLEAAEVARLGSQLPASSKSGYIRAGKQMLGNYIRAPFNEGGCAALREPALADVMIALRRGELRMPRYTTRHAIPLVPLSQLGERGLYHLDIGNQKEEKPPFRGPFKIVPVQTVPSYPILNNHDADRERYLVVQPDSEGEVRPDCDERATVTWQTATRLHFNLDFGLSSQSLAACLTPEPILGGRAWPNFRLQRNQWEEIIALWANSTLGLMSFWSSGSLQHPGRAILTIKRLPDLLILDPRSLSTQKLEHAKNLFEHFKSTPLLPANEAYRDETRKAIDQALLTDILELPSDLLAPLDNLRRQWCSEPSVHGRKSTAI